MDQKQLGFGVAAILASLIVAGCGGGTADAPTPSTPAKAVPPVNFKANVNAGVPVTLSTDVTRVAALPKSAAKYGTQANPADAFELRAGEKELERVQGMERAFSTIGGFTNEYEPSVDTKPLQTVEPQPYRRLSGIVVGDAVVGLIVMENGSTEVITPGKKIPNSEWTVVSMDEERAVLRRSGNVNPKQIVVRLENPPPGTQPATPAGGNPGFGPGGPGGFGPGGPGGFGPGGPPPGFGRGGSNNDGD
jgi:hypothetical protein